MQASLDEHYADLEKNLNLEPDIANSDSLNLVFFNESSNSVEFKRIFNKFDKIKVNFQKIIFIFITFQDIKNFITIKLKTNNNILLANNNDKTKIYSDEDKTLEEYNFQNNDIISFSIFK